MKKNFPLFIIFISLLSIKVIAQVLPFNTNQTIQNNLNEIDQTTLDISSILAAEYRIDSAIVYSSTDSTQQVFMYSSYNRVINVLDKHREGTEWVNTSRHSYMLDTDRNILIDLYQEWDSTGWVNNTKRTYTYDLNNNMLTLLEEKWLLNKWEAFNNWTYTYDVNSNLLTEIRRVWNGSDWSNFSRYQYEYNSNDDELLKSLELWDGSSWIFNYKYDFTYDADFNLIEKVKSNYSSGWLYDHRFTFSYDSSGNKLVEMKQVHDSTDWINENRRTFEYNTVNLVTLQVSQNWQDSVFVNNWKILSQYDASNNLTSMHQLTWLDSIWINQARMEQTFDEHGRVLAQVAQYWQDTVWNNSSKIERTFGADVITLKGYEYDPVNQWQYTDAYLYFEWDDLFYAANGYTTEIYFSPPVVSVDDKISTPEKYTLHQNYPNPFNPVTTISYSLAKESRVTLSVFNVLGEKVIELVNNLENEGQHKVSFDASSFSSGVYFYRIEATAADGSDGLLKTKKMILIK